VTVTTTLSAAQILALAPDSSSVKSSRELSIPRKWKLFAANEVAIWGECIGSGKDPYQTIVDLAQTAFKCSCPSRKFPCKHGLGLYLLFATEQHSFQRPEAAPDWVTDWLTKRSTPKPPRIETSTPTDHQNAEVEIVRESRRQSKVAGGIVDLQIWLSDLVRKGLADAPTFGYKFWDQIAARMVDAQAPGIARQLREMSSIAASGTDWQQKLLDRIALLHLLIEGFENRENLPADTVADIKTAIGWTSTHDDLSKSPGVYDQWTVIGQRIVEEDRLKARRTWLFGQQTHQIALLLHFAYGNATFEYPIAVDMVIDGELVFYPGAFPQRATLKSYVLNANSRANGTWNGTIASVVVGYSSAITCNPWVERIGVAISDVRLAIQGNNWLLHNSESHYLPISSDYKRAWQFLSVNGGHSQSVFGEWDGESFWPLTILDNGVLVAL